MAAPPATSASDAAKAVSDRAEATKEVLERTLESRRREMQDRRERRMQFNRLLADPSLDDAAKKRLQADFEAKEREILRDVRKRFSPADFEPLVTIGRGAFGEVMLVRSKENGHIYAMKKMLKDAMILKNQTAHIMAEKAALATVTEGADWVVRLHYSFQDDVFLYLVSDYCAGGDLMGLLIKLDTLPEALARFYAAEAICAIDAVHSAGYIHRDIKPDNFLLDHAGHLFLTDLGLCKNMEEEELDETTVHAVGEAGASALSPPPPGESHHDRPFVRDRKLAFSTVGTPDYIDAQVLLKKGYGMESDWWSLGTVLYECILGFPPFYGDSPVETCRKILHFKTSLKFPADRIKHVSPECVDFLKRMICEPERRLGARGGIEEIKGHPWFRGMDWARLRETPSPYVPANGKAVGALLTRLATLPKEDPSFAATVRELTSQFDDFAALAADDPRHGFGGGGHGAVPEAAASGPGGASKRFQRRFVGYTYKRPAGAGAGTGAAAATGGTASGAGASAGGSAGGSAGAGAASGGGHPPGHA